MKGTISIFVNRESTTIHVRDEASGVSFCEVTLTPEEFSSALSRLADTPCNITVRGVDKIGKKHEHKSFVFEIKERPAYHEHDGIRALAQQLLDEEGDGYISDGYFKSQDSFFERDGKLYAKCSVRRWINQDT